jgi:nucleoside-diphosphate-sugar epimerase
MKILISGATGFLGRYVLKELISLEHELFLIVRNEGLIPGLVQECPNVTFYIHDYLNSAIRFTPQVNFDIFLNLAWGNLDDFKSSSHLSEELPAHKRLVNEVIKAGVKSIISLGTCLEYSKLEGEIPETAPCKPEIPYAIAKNQFREYLDAESKSEGIQFTWVRLFYFYGSGQQDRTLFGHLLNAVNLKQNTFFANTDGYQKLDYMRVDDVAKNLVLVLLAKDSGGEINLCSGVARPVREIVNDWIQEFNWNIQIVWGTQKPRNYETSAFWGATVKLEKITSMKYRNQIEK